jgi:hypothetical protein
MMLLACLIAAPAKTGPEMNGRWDSIQAGVGGSILACRQVELPCVRGQGFRHLFPAAVER